VTPAEKYLHPHLHRACLPPFVTERDSPRARRALDFASNVPECNGAREYAAGGRAMYDAVLRSLFTGREASALTADHLVVVRGVSEGIDLLTRSAAGPGRPVAAFGPTFPMYRYWASLSGAAYVEVDGFPLWERGSIPRRLPNRPKLWWVCRPNNPTGHTVSLAALGGLAPRLRALVAVDETYVDFAGTTSAVGFLRRHDNVVVARSLSKAWMLAGERIGVLVAHPSVARVLRAIQGPYAIPSSTLRLLEELPGRRSRKDACVEAVVEERARLLTAIERLRLPVVAYPSGANFVCLASPRTEEAIRALRRGGFWVGGDATAGLRFSVRSRRDNDRLLEALTRFFGRGRRASRRFIGAHRAGGT
jgi:histidinol-phosphate aminotransferase